MWSINLRTKYYRIKVVTEVGIHELVIELNSYGQPTGNGGREFTSCLIHSLLSLRSCVRLVFMRPFTPYKTKRINA